MGMVALTFRIMPESTDTDLSKIKDGIKEAVSKHVNIEIKAMDEKPVAFGLKAIELLITMPDKVSGTDKLEEDISAISGVASVEAGDVTLI